MTTETAHSIEVTQEIIEEELRRQNPQLPSLTRCTTFGECALKDGPAFLWNIMEKLAQAHRLSTEQRQLLHEHASRSMICCARVDNLVRTIAGDLAMLIVTG